MVSGEQFEAVVAAVVEDEIGAGEGLEMGESGPAFVAVGVQVEIDGQAGVDSGTGDGAADSRLRAAGAAG